MYGYASRTTESEGIAGRLTAKALAKVIEQEGPGDPIFTGKQSVDSEGMQTHFRLAERLGIPAATNVIKLKADTDSVQVECEREPGTIDVIRMTTPCVLGSGKGLNTPKYPTFPDIVKSRKKEVRKIGLPELSIEEPAAGMTIEELAHAEEQRTPRALTGKPADIAAQIVDILKNEAKVI